MTALRCDRLEHQQWQAEREDQRKREREERIRHEFERRLNPRSKEDFEVLYHALESESRPHCVLQDIGGFYGYCTHPLHV